MNHRLITCLLVALASLFMEAQSAAVTSTWTGSGDGVSWHQGANWSGGVVPPAGGDVNISVPASNPTIQFTSSAGTVQINSLTTSELLTISGGTLQVATTFQTSQNITLKGLRVSANGIRALDSQEQHLGREVPGENPGIQNYRSLTVKNGMALSHADRIYNRSGSIRSLMLSCKDG